MRGNRLPKLITAAALLAVCASAAVAFPRFARMTKASCATCHTNVAGGAVLTDAGKAFKADTTKAPAASVAGSDFASTKKCKMCHINEYKSWLETPHAKALEVLKTGDPKKIEEMAARAGVKLTGGYPAADSLTTASLASVTCEACHGPGSKHVAADKPTKKTVINGQVGELLCRSCHTPSMSPAFDFAKYKAKGLHAVKTAE